MAIVGPTASGKTKVGVELALRLEGEVVNYDSLQLYRYFNIGTAKPTEEEKRGIPHHLMDILDPSQDFNAYLYAELAKKKIEEIRKRGKVPILVGGTGLYLKALEEGFFELEDDIEPYRKKAKEIIEKEGLSRAYSIITEADPELRKTIGERDRVRIERALEIYLMTGRSIRELQEKSKNQPDSVSIFKIGLIPERKDLHRRIDERVEDMFRKGWVEEVKGILSMGYSEDMKPLRAIGYKEIVDYLKGRLELEEAKSIIKKRTRNYARRQIIWFRKEKVVWFNPPYNTRAMEELIKKALER